MSLDYEWQLGDQFRAITTGKGESVKDCVRDARKYVKGNFPRVDQNVKFSVREYGASKYENYRSFINWLSDFGLRWPKRPYALRDGSCGRCHREIEGGPHRISDHWHCQCPDLGGNKFSFQWLKKRSCEICGMHIPPPSERFIHNHKPGDGPRGPCNCEFPAGLHGSRRSYCIHCAKRRQAIAYALDLSDTPELTGRNLHMAELRHKVAGIIHYMGMHDPGLDDLSEGQLLELYDRGNAADRAQIRRFNDYARSQGVDPRCGYSSSGG